ncbi:MAG: glycoside hydrolase family 92 protein [Lachnospiraceae bacterium]|jgi:putative alpha-1,2-mannosidase|nr:GH92 family glycosyl hydrolase [uncultured Acetatifactor sp.]MCI9218601.1 glycoside hydrolase family 92 protein [Lachnospiraceae bacterium]
MKNYQYVNTIVGAVADIPDCYTGSVPAGGGKTYPGACAPWGAVQFSPDTVTGGDNGPGYSYHNTAIEGFGINHLSGIGWYGDLGNFQVMPVIGEVPFHSALNAHSRYQPGTPGRESEFCHDTELTQAGHYGVTLSRYHIRVETTATIHCGIARMIFPETDKARVLIDLSRRIGGYSQWQEIRVVDQETIEGSIYCPHTAGGWGHGNGHVTYTLHFYAKFSRPFEKFGVWESGKDLGPQTHYRGETSGFYAEYAAEEGEEILLKAGISYVSVRNARQNLETEAPHWEFDRYVAKVQAAWEAQLCAVQASGPDKDKQKFYTCLYHVFLDPRNYTDCNGEFLAPDESVQKTDDYLCRTVFSGWDVYRSGREDMRKYGYIPGDISQTLENAFCDWCVSRFAKAAGHMEDAEKLEKQSRNYRNIFDPETGWARRKDAHGNWMETAGLYDERGCVESNIFQQSWFVPHDIPGLIGLMGGEEEFCERLEKFLSGADLSALWNDDYNHSNEPCHTVAHLFNFAGKPWRTQYWVRRIQNEAYHEGPFGYCGNEDVGQMSAWFVLTALGFHSTTAASGRYDLNTPYFQKQTVKLNPKYHSCIVSDTLTIETDCDPGENWYIRGVALNGKPVSRPFVTYEELTAGGVLWYELSAEPCNCAFERVSI